MNTQQNILITGASGFIGPHVLQSLAERDIPYYALMRHPPAAPLPGKGQLLLGDLQSATFPCPFTHCLHLAWGHLPDYKNTAHLEHELPLHQAFLQRLFAQGLKHLLVTGTCLEYGMQSGALSETSPLQPTLPYSAAKAALFHWLNTQAPSFTLTWARLFYTFGKGQHPNSLYSQLHRAIETGQSEFDMSGGEQLRDFLPVETVADILVELLLQNKSYGAVNIGTGTPISVLTIVEHWLTLKNNDMTLNLGVYPYPAYEPMEFWADSTKLMSILPS